MSNNIRQLHDNAMAAAEKAFFAKRAGDIDLAKTLIYEAYKNEKSAAESLSTQIDKEPSRSVLFRSAATLAYECGEYREAEKLISNGLFGNPPDEIANELRDLLEQVNFTRHLQNQNITLLEDEIQMSFVGNDIGKGFAPFNIFLSRMKDFERIIQRFRDRISKVPFKEQPKSISSGKNCCLYLSVPREGSFSVTLRLTSQMELPNISISKNVINEIMECFSLINENRQEDLKEKINDESYYINFLGLAKKIAPDGDKVSNIVLTTTQDGKKNQVQIKKEIRNINIPTINKREKQIEKGKEITVSGRLKFADGTKQEGIIHLHTDKGDKYSVVVPEGMMNDIVRPMWDLNVTVTGYQISGRKDSLYLINIEEAS